MGLGESRQLTSERGYYSSDNYQFPKKESKRFGNASETFTRAGGMEKVVMFYIPAPKGKAKEIVEHLLSKRLIACANIIPSQSFYWWKGKIAAEEEEIILAKTTKEKSTLVQKEVKKIHPYTLPCLLEFSGTVNQEYGRWVQKETTQKS